MSKHRTMGRPKFQLFLLLIAMAAACAHAGGLEKLPPPNAPLETGTRHRTLAADAQQAPATTAAMNTTANTTSFSPGAGTVFVTFGTILFDIWIGFCMLLFGCEIDKV